jgi:dihydroorotase
MRLVASLPGAVVAEHPEDRSLSADGHLNEGEMSALHGVIGLPGVAEEVIVARDLALAEDTGAPIHIQHVSTAGSVEMIRQAKRRGLSVTAEVTPHHLAMDDSALEQLDPILKMYPPLRGAGDRKAVGEALRLGVIDAVATDHAPHAGFEKTVPFEEAPRGVIGLETAAAVANRAVDGDPGLFFDRLSTAPARIAGLARQGNAVEPGAPANLVVFDPNLEWRVKGFESKSGNSPFLGREMTGKVLATINEGRVTYEGRS